jgi:tetratricopeptide (TPR) repeat protein
MTEEFTIQCENCGTIYPDTDEVCPYCGAPQPLPPETYDHDELLPAEEGYAGQDDALPDEAYFPPPAPDMPLEEEYATDEYPADDPLANDDIFAIVEEETGQGEYDEYHEPDELDDEAEAYDEYEEDEFDEEEIAPRRFRWSRLLVGCLSILVCIGLFYGGIGAIAVYQGIQERASEAQVEAEEHYRRGQEHFDNNELELAIAEFEHALRLNPTLHPAREALHEAQRIVQSRPTPTSETRLAAATSLLADAETQIAQENWPEALETLSEVRDLDPNYQAEYVSELLYQAHYQLGLQLISPDEIEDALLAFEQALAERPDDQAAILQKNRASFYIEGTTAAEQNNISKAVEAFRELYQQDANYLDVKKQLFQAYAQFGDELAADGEWCLAETHYVEATFLQPDDTLEIKAEQSRQRCEETETPQTTSATVRTPTSSANGPIAATPAITATTTSTVSVSSGNGKILFSAFNPNEVRWEILSVPASGGSPEMVVANGTMPALSPNGQLLVYHSELIEAEGLHLLNLTSGEDNRLTIFKQHLLPRWGGDNEQFLFVAQEPGTERWLIQEGFADGKSEPIILRDGRTPDWSSDNELIAYHGANAEGNDPGIYIVPFDGGEATRLTNHESDRAPDFSPDGSQLAYMSTRNGNWDIYTISTAGSAPRQITTSSGNDGLPAWSPDGRQIAFVSDADGNWAIYVIDAQGGTPSRVAEWDGNRPDWLLAQIWWAR